ncbi:hypothetical protein ADUPG1_013856, partial [Aduncisulcus paluster]
MRVNKLMCERPKEYDDRSHSNLIFDRFRELIDKFLVVQGFWSIFSNQQPEKAVSYLLFATKPVDSCLTSSVFVSKLLYVIFFSSTTIVHDLTITIINMCIDNCITVLNKLADEFEMCLYVSGSFVPIVDTICKYLRKMNQTRAKKILLNRHGGLNVTKPPHSFFSTNHSISSDSSSKTVYKIHKIYKEPSKYAITYDLKHGSTVSNVLIDDEQGVFLPFLEPVTITPTLFSSPSTSSMRVLYPPNIQLYVNHVDNPLLFFDGMRMSSQPSLADTRAIGSTQHGIQYETNGQSMPVPPSNGYYYSDGVEGDPNDMERLALTQSSGNISEYQTTPNSQQQPRYSIHQFGKDPGHGHPSAETLGHHATLDDSNVPRPPPFRPPDACSEHIECGGIAIADTAEGIDNSALLAKGIVNLKYESSGRIFHSRSDDISSKRTKSLLQMNHHTAPTDDKDDVKSIAETKQEVAPRTTRYDPKEDPDYTPLPTLVQPDPNDSFSCFLPRARMMTLHRPSSHQRSSESSTTTPHKSEGSGHSCDCNPFHSLLESHNRDIYTYPIHRHQNQCECTSKMSQGVGSASVSQDSRSSSVSSRTDKRDLRKRMVSTGTSQRTRTKLRSHQHEYINKQSSSHISSRMSVKADVYVEDSSEDDDDVVLHLSNDDASSEDIRHVKSSTSLRGMHRVKHRLNDTHSSILCIEDELSDQTTSSSEYDGEEQCPWCGKWRSRRQKKNIYSLFYHPHSYSTTGDLCCPSEDSCFIYPQSFSNLDPRAATEEERKEMEISRLYYRHLHSHMREKRTRVERPRRKKIRRKIRKRKESSDNSEKVKKKHGHRKKKESEKKPQRKQQHTQPTMDVLHTPSVSKDGKLDRLDCSSKIPSSSLSRNSPHSFLPSDDGPIPSPDLSYSFNTHLHVCSFLQSRSHLCVKPSTFIWKPNSDKKHQGKTKSSFYSQFQQWSSGYSSGENSRSSASFASEEVYVLYVAQLLSHSLLTRRQTLQYGCNALLDLFWKTILDPNEGLREAQREQLMGNRSAPPGRPSKSVNSHAPTSADPSPRPSLYAPLGLSHRVNVNEVFDRLNEWILNLYEDKDFVTRRRRIETMRSIPSESIPLAQFPQYSNRLDPFHHHSPISARSMFKQMTNFDSLYDVPALPWWVVWSDNPIDSAREQPNTEDKKKTSNNPQTVVLASEGARFKPSEGSDDVFFDSSKVKGSMTFSSSSSISEDGLESREPERITPPPLNSFAISSQNQTTSTISSDVEIPEVVFSSRSRLQANESISGLFTFLYLPPPPPDSMLHTHLCTQEDVSLFFAPLIMCFSMYHDLIMCKRESRWELEWEKMRDENKNRKESRQEWRDEMRRAEMMHSKFWWQEQQQAARSHNEYEATEESDTQFEISKGSLDEYHSFNPQANSVVGVDPLLKGSIYNETSDSVARKKNKDIPQGNIPIRIPKDRIPAYQHTTLPIMCPFQSSSEESCMCLDYPQCDDTFGLKRHKTDESIWSSQKNRRMMNVVILHTWTEIQCRFRNMLRKKGSKTGHQNFPSSHARFSESSSLPSTFTPSLSSTLMALKSPKADALIQKEWDSLEAFQLPENQAIVCPDDRTNLTIDRGLVLKSMWIGLKGTEYEKKKLSFKRFRDLHAVRAWKRKSCIKELVQMMEEEDLIVRRETKAFRMLHQIYRKKGTFPNTKKGMKSIISHEIQELSSHIKRRNAKWESRRKVMNSIISTISTSRIPTLDDVEKEDEIRFLERLFVIGKHFPHHSNNSYTPYLAFSSSDENIALKLDQVEWFAQLIGYSEPDGDDDNELNVVNSPAALIRLLFPYLPPNYISPFKTSVTPFVPGSDVRQRGMLELEEDSDFDLAALSMDSVDSTASMSVSYTSPSVTRDSSSQHQPWAQNKGQVNQDMKSAKNSYSGSHSSISGSPSSSVTSIIPLPANIYPSFLSFVRNMRGVPAIKTSTDLLHSIRSNCLASKIVGCSNIPESLSSLPSSQKRMNPNSKLSVCEILAMENESGVSVGDKPALDLIAQPLHSPLVFAMLYLPLFLISGRSVMSLASYSSISFHFILAHILSTASTSSSILSSLTAKPLFSQQCTQAIVTRRHPTSSLEANGVHQSILPPPCVQWYIRQERLHNRQRDQQKKKKAWSVSAGVDSINQWLSEREKLRVLRKRWEKKKKMSIVLSKVESILSEDSPSAHSSIVGGERKSDQIYSEIKFYLYPSEKEIMNIQKRAHDHANHCERHGKETFEKRLMFSPYPGSSMSSPFHSSSSLSTLTILYPSLTLSSLLSHDTINTCVQGRAAYRDRNRKKRDSVEEKMRKAEEEKMIVRWSATKREMILMTADAEDSLSLDSVDKRILEKKKISRSDCTITKKDRKGLLPIDLLSPPGPDQQYSSLKMKQSLIRSHGEFEMLKYTQLREKYLGYHSKNTKEREWKPYKPSYQLGEQGLDTNKTSTKKSFKDFLENASVRDRRAMINQVLSDFYSNNKMIAANISLSSLSSLFQSNESASLSTTPQNRISQRFFSLSPMLASLSEGPSTSELHDSSNPDANSPVPVQSSSSSGSRASLMNSLSSLFQSNESASLSTTPQNRISQRFFSLSPMLASLSEGPSTSELHDSSNPDANSPVPVQSSSSSGSRASLMKFLASLPPCSLSLYCPLHTIAHTMARMPLLVGERVHPTKEKKRSRHLDGVSVDNQENVPLHLSFYHECFRSSPQQIQMKDAHNGSIDVQDTLPYVFNYLDVFLWSNPLLPPVMVFPSSHLTPSEFVKHSSFPFSSSMFSVCGCMCLFSGKEWIKWVKNIGSHNTQAQNFDHIHKTQYEMKSSETLSSPSGDIVPNPNNADSKSSYFKSYVLPILEHSDKTTKEKQRDGYFDIQSISRPFHPLSLSTSLSPSRVKRILLAVATWVSQCASGCGSVGCKSSSSCRISQADCDGMGTCGEKGKREGRKGLLPLTDPYSVTAFASRLPSDIKDWVWSREKELLDSLHASCQDSPHDHIPVAHIAPFLSFHDEQKYLFLVAKTMPVRIGMCTMLRRL